jgi:aldose 1-epimerase
MACRAESEQRGANKIYTLKDDVSGAYAAVLPSQGFNLFDLQLPVAGAVRRVVVAADDFAERPRPGAGNGVPILFPYPNRVRDASFVFQDRTYSLPPNNAPNSIHGFAVDAVWDVADHGADARSAWITGRYQISKDSPQHLERWPTDAILEVTYVLSGRRLTMTVAVTNPTARDLPYGFGIHPYFRLPFGPEGDLDRTRVILPAGRFWVLEKFLPTGEIRPVDDRLDFRQGQPIRGLSLDDVLTGLQFVGDRATCRLVDLAGNGEFRLSFDRRFRELVVYTPPDRPGVISLEPYTQTTDAINLQRRGVDAGLRVLKHGEHERMDLTLETLG